jgi:hypothetical protein
MKLVIQIAVGIVLGNFLTAFVCTALLLAYLYHTSGIKF